MTSARARPEFRSEQIARLRDVLAAAQYTEQNAALALRLPMPLRIPGGNVSWLSRRLSREGALPALLRLFLLGESVEGAALQALPPPGAASQLVDAGFLRVEDDRFRADFRITPVGDLLIAHDPEEPVLPDHVPGLGPASRTLAGLTVRERVALALDLGTGCGIQALLAASHADRVVATDISERALEFARFNAALNRIDNVEFRQGNLFEPVEGEAFDLIIANPPFVISPDTAYTFRDSGLGRDAVSAAVITGAAARLREGGRAAILFSWIHSNEDSEGPVRAWLDGAGCDTWVLHHQSEEPLDYAVKWNELARREGSAQFEAAVGRWLEYYAAERIEQIANGAAILQKRAGENWFRVERMPGSPQESASAHILRVFAAQGRMQELGDEELLLGETFSLVDGHRLDQSMVYRAREFTIDSIQMYLDEGVGLRGRIQPLAIHVLLRLDGQQSLRALIAVVEEELGLEHTELQQAVVTSVRELYGLGFLTAAGMTWLT